MEKKHNVVLYQDEALEDLQYHNLWLIQNKKQYRFTTDAVALANFVKVKPRENMVDLCAGSGVVGILAMAKGKGNSCTLVEIQSSMADMAKRSLEYNNIDNIKVVNDKLQGISDKIGKDCYDLVTCNPPYKVVDGSQISVDPSIAIARHEIAVTLKEVIEEASKLLKYGGRLALVHKSYRMAEMMYLCSTFGLEPKRLKILPSKKGMSVVLLEAVKDGKVGLKIEE